MGPCGARCKCGWELLPFVLGASHVPRGPWGGLRGRGGGGGGWLAVCWQGDFGLRPGGLAWEGECELWGGGGCCMMSWGWCHAPGDLIGALRAAQTLGTALGALFPLEGAGCAHAPVPGDPSGLECEVGGSTLHCLGCF